MDKAGYLIHKFSLQNEYFESSFNPANNRSTKNCINIITTHQISRNGTPKFWFTVPFSSHNKYLIYGRSLRMWYFYISWQYTKKSRESFSSNELLFPQLQMHALSQYECISSSVSQGCDLHTGIRPTCVYLGTQSLLPPLQAECSETK